MWQLAQGSHILHQYGEVGKEVVRGGEVHVLGHHNLPSHQEHEEKTGHVQAGGEYDLRAVCRKASC